jgi:hypothetical protein
MATLEEREFQLCQSFRFDVGNLQPHPRVTRKICDQGLLGSSADIEGSFRRSASVFVFTALPRMYF